MVNEWIARHRKEYNEYLRKIRKSSKRELVNYMGGKCAKCGLKPEEVEDCMMVFVIDEIIPLNIKKKFSWGLLSQPRMELVCKLFDEKKVQLLCQNCNAIKTWKNNDAGHRFPKKEKGRYLKDGN